MTSGSNPGHEMDFEQGHIRYTMPHPPEREVAFIFVDGTSQYKTQATPTNVALLHDALRDRTGDGLKVSKRYYDGTGTRNWLNVSEDEFFLTKALKAIPNTLVRNFNAATGAAMERNLKEIYKNIVLKHHMGKTYAFCGFSRGAFAVRTLCGLMYKSGILDSAKFTDKQTGAIDHGKLDEAIDKALAFYRTPEKPSSPEARAFRTFYDAEQPIVEALVDLDAVKSLGLPKQLGWLARRINKQFEHHDTQLNRKVKHAFKFIAAEEEKKNFMYDKLRSILPHTCNKVVGMCASHDSNTQVKQFIAVGNHGCVGGGTKKRQDFSNIVALETIEQLTNLDLSFQFDHAHSNWLRAKSDITVRPNDRFKDGLMDWLLGFGYEPRPLPHDAHPIRKAVNRFEACAPYANDIASEEWRHFKPTESYIKNRAPQ